MQRKKQTFVEGMGGRKLAVTVLMLRDTAEGLEVYVQERVSSMPTFPNATVFPGGGVDPRDFEEPSGGNKTWGGPPLQEWAHRLDVDRHKARAIICGAIRELFEETGTLLASHADGTPVMNATPYHEDRLALESHRISLTEVLSTHSLVLQSGYLHPFARWVTARSEPFHFDTYYFLAQAPEGQDPDGNTREAASTGWFRPNIILDGWRAGLLRLVLPTWAQLWEIARYDTVEEVFEAHKEPDIRPVIGDPVTDKRYQEFFELIPPVRI